MDVKFANPLINATLGILGELTSIQYEVGKPYLKGDDVAKGDLSGIIGLSGDVSGTIAITFEEKVIMRIVSDMFKEEITGINDEVIDAVGELNNMITGRAIAELTEKGIDLKFTVPIVIHGKNHIVKHLTEGPKIAIPFSTEEGKFTIEISFQ